MTSGLETGRRAAILAVAVSGVLTVIKLIAGIVGHSYALIADAIESGSDILASFIVWGGLSVASKPADSNHPYGHGRAETLAGLAVAMLLLGAAAAIAIQAVREILTPHHLPSVFTLPVVIGVFVVKELLYRYLIRVGDTVGARSLAADAWHHRSDGLTSLAAAVGITFALLGGKGYESADDWAALAACGIIAFNGFRFARGALEELMDTAPDPQLDESIRVAGSKLEGVLGIEKVHIRKVGPSYYVDLHLEVDPEWAVQRAHALGHEVKDAIIKEVPHVADVLVHLEPHPRAGPSRHLN